MARSWIARALGLAFVLAACVTTELPAQPTPSTATPLPSSPPTASATPTAMPTATPAATASPTEHPTAPPPSATPSPIPGAGATINLANFRSEVAGFEIVTFDTDKTAKSMGTLNLNEFDELSYGGIPAGVYRLIFHGATPAADDPACDFAVADGDTYVFAVLPSGIALARSSQPPANAADLLVPTSSLCHVQP